MKLLKYIIALFMILIMLSFTLPKLFPMIDNTNFKKNYRIPYELGEDYYLYEKYMEHLNPEKNILFIGDSVIWGHYVSANNSLSAQLNKIHPNRKFNNAGIDGIHPAAMKGLIEHYGNSIKNKKVILGINILWMSSPRHDLTGDENNEINHRSLLSQFSENIPAYKSTIEEKVSYIINRNLPLIPWVNHIKRNYFKDESFYRWTLKNPHKMPSNFFVGKKPKVYELPKILAGKSMKQNVRWVNIEKSLQWRSLQESIKKLSATHNEVLALITPYNREMLTDESLGKYQKNINLMKKYFKENNIEYIDCEKLDSKYFSDASHPNKDGYRFISEKLSNNREFSDFIKK